MPRDRDITSPFHFFLKTRHTHAFPTMPTPVTTTPGPSRATATAQPGPSTTTTPEEATLAATAARAVGDVVNSVSVCCVLYCACAAILGYSLLDRPSPEPSAR